MLPPFPFLFAVYGRYTNKRSYSSTLGLTEARAARLLAIMPAYVAQRQARERRKHQARRAYGGRQRRMTPFQRYGRLSISSPFPSFFFLTRPFLCVASFSHRIAVRYFPSVPSFRLLYVKDLIADAEPSVKERAFVHRLVLREAAELMATLAQRVSLSPLIPFYTPLALMFGITMTAY
jgi:hypothetical protein